ncbi:MAG: ABC transporter permease [Flavobacteriales bacterium]|nr:ABC transporter permease [Flavobacteriales bacterium]|tara:strand:+ start:56557 stop:57804 length:1248 start_codon:yes stop_codon:yes gene_type:complete
MHKIWLVIKREFLVRVRKKSFVIMTFLGPILLASILILPIYLANNSQEKRNIAVGYQKDFQLEDNELLNFVTIPQNEVDSVKFNIKDSPYYALLIIRDNTFSLYSNQQVTLNVTSEIKRQIEHILKLNNLRSLGIDNETLKIAEQKINLETKIINKEGESTNSHSEVSTGIGFLGGILIYMFIFMYGTMVMRGVIEEKTSRIVEVMISSLRPFQLMMGKIIGVALVGLTQFLLWIIFTVALSALAELVLLNDAFLATSSAENQSIIITQIKSFTSGINLIQIFLSFLFYFIAGYLMYSSLFAAVGSAVDAEADTQQFILPVTLPLILSFILIQPIMDNPEGSLAFWLSIIPFTSPVIMMVRLPFGVENWEIILSMTILVSTFIITTWLAGKIYRIGILMYGKKANIRELLKWIRY